MRAFRPLVRPLLGREGVVGGAGAGSGDIEAVGADLTTTIGSERGSGGDR